MSGKAVKTLMLAKAQDLEQALRALHDAESKQQQLKLAHPDAYDASFHAAGIAQHAQGIRFHIEQLQRQLNGLSQASVPPIKRSRPRHSAPADPSDLEPGLVLEQIPGLEVAVSSVVSDVRQVFGKLDRSRT